MVDSTQDRDHWRALVNEAFKLQPPGCISIGVRDINLRTLSDQLSPRSRQIRVSKIFIAFYFLVYQRFSYAKVRAL